MDDKPNPKKAYSGSHDPLLIIGPQTLRWNGWSQSRQIL